MNQKLLLSLSLFSLLSCQTIYAEDSFDNDLDGFLTENGESELVEDDSMDELDGFGDDSSDEVAEIPAPKVESKKYTLNGDLAFKTSAGLHSHKVDGVEYGGVNQAQTSLFLQFDYKISDDWKLRISGDAFYDSIYDIRTNNDYNDDVIETYKTQFMMQDAYLQGKITNNFDMKIGHQIVVWGKSDSIRITDVINPLDNRLPGMTDIEDLRLSVGMIKGDYYIGSWNLSAMFIGENKIMLEAAPRGEFFPVDSIMQPAPSPFMPLVEPAYNMENLQFAFAANGVFSGWDLSFYLADVFDSKWHLNQTTNEREVSKIQMIGSAINIAAGSYLLKSEIALIDGNRYNSTQDEKLRFDSLVGVDYMGIKDTVLSLEIASRYIFDYENQMITRDFVEKDEIQTAMRITRSFENDTINANALVSMFGSSWENGGFARVWVEYDVMDAVVANIGVVDYIGGDKVFFDAIKQNDRIFADISYSF